MIEKKSILEKTEQDNDAKDDHIRPSRLNDFIGQTKIIDNLSIFIKAAQNRGKTLEHVLFHGPPGLGKTSLASIVASEMGVNFKATSGPVIAKAGDLAAILTNLEPGDVLFIDEIHRLNTVVEEILYPAMEDFHLDIIIGEGPAARSVRINIAPFTLVGATTRLGLLSNPLRDRFGIPLRLNFYEAADLSTIIKRASKILSIKVNETGAFEIAKRSRGTPRIALRLLRRVSDFALVKGDNVIDEVIANEALHKLEVDNMGLDSNDKRYLKFIAENYAGGPVGIETIAAGLSEQKDSIEDTIEPFLLQSGLINRTPRGRMLTEAAFKHLGLPVNNKLIPQFEIDFTDENYS